MSSQVFQPPEEAPVEAFDESLRHVLGPGRLFRLYLLYCVSHVVMGALVALLGLVGSLLTVDVMGLFQAPPSPFDPRWALMFLVPLGLVSVAMFQLPLLLGRTRVGWGLGFVFLGLGLLHPLMLAPAVLLLRHWGRAKNRAVLTGRY